QDAEAIFPFKAYGPLCIVDPAHRPNAERPGEVRKVPSFRWLRMVVFRERVVSDIIALLAQQGHRLPVSTARAALKKCWFLMDIPTNAGRIGLLHNTAYEVGRAGFEGWGLGRERLLRPDELVMREG
ncbi:GTP cyclohydrolase 1, partial [Cryomyces antarcticus]